MKAVTTIADHISSYADGLLMQQTGIRRSICRVAVFGCVCARGTYNELTVH